MKTIWYHIGTESPVTPETHLPELPDIPRGALAIVEGRAPVWRYGMAFHRLHGLAAVVAVYDPRLGAVVVASHTAEYCEGDILDVAPLTCAPLPDSK